MIGQPGDVISLETMSGPSVNRARHTCARSVPPVQIEGLSPGEIMCAAWLCSYAHVPGVVQYGAARRVSFATIRHLFHEASVNAGIDPATGIDRGSWLGQGQRGNDRDDWIYAHLAAWAPRGDPPKPPGTPPAASASVTPPPFPPTETLAPNPRAASTLSFIRPSLLVMGTSLSIVALGLSVDFHAIRDTGACEYSNTLRWGEFSECLHLALPLACILFLMCF